MCMHTCKRTDDVFLLMAKHAHTFPTGSIILLVLFISRHCFCYGQHKKNKKNFAVNNSCSRREKACTSTVGMALCELAQSVHCCVFYTLFYSHSTCLFHMQHRSRALRLSQRLSNIFTGDQLRQHKDGRPLNNYQNQALGAWKTPTRTLHSCTIVFVP